MSSLNDANNENIIENIDDINKFPEFILHEGAVMQVDEFELPGLNTALLFGESAFVSFRTYEGKVAHFDKHMERLVSSAEYLDFDLSSDIWDEVQDSLSLLRKKCVNHYFRVTLFSYLDGSVDFFIWCRPIENNLNTSVSLKSMEVKSPLFFNDVKIGQYAEIFRTGRRARVLYPDFDEVILVDQDEKLFECATSNFFCVDNGKVISPSFETGVYKGIFVSEFFRYLDEKNMPREIKDLTLEDVKKKDISCFICNSVKGIRPVHLIDDTKISLMKDDVELINKYINEVGGYEQVPFG
jgi:branched-subunit amino acid aminotransferase/4-amino-4-deoxychorismate lyase